MASTHDERKFIQLQAFPWPRKRNMENFLKNTPLNSFCSIFQPLCWFRLIKSPRLFDTKE